MHGSTKAEVILDPYVSRCANALQVNGSVSPAQILLVSGESSIKESRHVERRKKSSWIRRLKPREELDLSRGGSAQASLEITYSARRDLCEGMDLGSGSVQPGLFLQEMEVSGARARPIREAQSVSDAKRQKKYCHGAEEQSRYFYQEKTTMVETEKRMTLPSNVGFGPWVNLSSGRKQDTKPELGLSSKVIASTVMPSSQKSCKDIQGNFCSAFNSTNSIPRGSPVSMVGDVTAPSNFCKSPLSPVHSKLGLPPRPPSQKSPGFHPPSKVAPPTSGMSRGGFHQFAHDLQPNRPLLGTPCNSEHKQSAGLQDKDTSELTEAAVGRLELSFQKLKPSERSFSDSIREQGKSVSDCGQQFIASSFTRMNNSKVPMRCAIPSGSGERGGIYSAIGQPLGNCPDGAAVQFENGRREVHEGLHQSMSVEGAREPTNLPSDGADLHLKVSALGMEDSKAASKYGSRLQTVSMEPSKISLQQSPSGSSYGTSTSEKADVSVSTSASLPWEMFIESAGPSRKAREQFVEVYNRARDELKNQRMSQIMSRASSKEIDGGTTKLTLGSGDAAADHRSKGQLLKREQVLAGQSLGQGWVHILPSTNPEHTTLSLASSPKQQHSISFADSKGPVATLANEQNGLQRQNSVPSKSDTPWKHADNFRGELTLPEGQPKSSVQTVVVQEGNQQIACQRLDESHRKGVRPDGKGQFFSSSLAANTKEQASEFYESNGLGQTARLSHQLNDMKESAPALSKKRSHVTFEEHSISRIAEKGATSGVRPQSRPHVWLQRWHATAAHNSTKGLPDAQVPSEGKRSDSVSHFTLGLKKFKDGDVVGLFGRSKELKNLSADKEKGVKRASPSKMLPSAAAMAIVGTAARQFCSAQPQRKGSFAFWSGFGMPPPRKVEPVEEKGKAKMFMKADVNMPNC